MLPPERKRKILNIVKESHEVSIKFLRDELDNLPYSTLSRDLRELEKNKKILRRHGKVTFHPYIVHIPVEEDADRGDTKTSPRRRPSVFLRVWVFC